VYAISFDLIVADTEASHPEGVSQAYADIAVDDRLIEAS
jgi:virulence-associated protein VapD